MSSMHVFLWSAFAGSPFLFAVLITNPASWDSWTSALAMIGAIYLIAARLQGTSTRTKIWALFVSAVATVDVAVLTHGMSAPAPLPPHALQNLSSMLVGYLALALTASLRKRWEQGDLRSPGEQ